MGEKRREEKGRRRDALTGREERGWEKEHRRGRIHVMRAGGDMVRKG